MFSLVKTSTLTGIDAKSIEVEVEVKKGPERFIIIGLGDAAIRESKERIMSALQHSGFLVPKQILVNLAPAELKKEGSLFDLSIAIGILIASKQMQCSNTNGVYLFGELSLTGIVKPVRGIVSLTIEALQSGGKEVILPKENLPEASLIESIGSVGVHTLHEAIHYLERGIIPKSSQAVFESSRKKLLIQKGYGSNGDAFEGIYGHETAKRALTIAAAGGHNVLMIGPPGCGKSMFAKKFPMLLPKTDCKERLEIVKIHSIAGQEISNLLQGERPFRNPHYTISEAGLVGGGGSLIKPGEISLAHCGVLFLDELPEFKRTVIESLRTPLETGAVKISRAKHAVEFATRFQLIAAMNCCPCGKSTVSHSECRCSLEAKQRYMSRVSQPIIDRIDIHLELLPVPKEYILQWLSKKRDENHNQEQELCAEKKEKDMISVQEKILHIQDIQYQRSGKLNAFLDNNEIASFAALDEASQLLIQRAEEKFSLSVRGVMKVLKVARTIADFERREKVTRTDVAEAVSYRILDRRTSTV
jgi:magnesium chelatase family protein